MRNLSAVYKRLSKKKDKISRDILEWKSGYLVITDVSQIALKSWSQETVTSKLPTTPFGVVVCTWKLLFPPPSHEIAAYHFCFPQQVTTVETVEGGIHGEELWGVDDKTDGGDSKQDEETVQELKAKVNDLEQQVENYKKVLEESIQEPEANKLMELVEQVRSEREDLASKCKELEGKVNEEGQSKEDMQAAIEELGTRLKELEQSNLELERELSVKTQSEIDSLVQIKDLQDELTKALEAFKELEELKDKLQEDLETSEETQKDLEREKVTMQKQLNDGFLQISALKVR